MPQNPVFPGRSTLSPTELTETLAWLRDCLPKQGTPPDRGCCESTAELGSSFRFVDTGRSRFYLKKKCKGNTTAFSVPKGRTCSNSNQRIKEISL